MKECTVCHRCFPDNVNHCPSDGDILKFTITGDTMLDGRYQLEKRLGQGGMGVVFKARHIFLKTQHAIKIILPDLVGNDPSLLTRFRQEAMAAAATHHLHIISVTDYGVINDSTPYLVMEFIEGTSLHELIAEGGRLAPALALEIMMSVAAGVGAAHRQGIIHRDLKPLNIMLKSGLPLPESVKILDFGLAKIKSGELLGSFIAAQTQGMMGSPFYMAPEQWGDEEPDRRADIYSLGVILYQMLSGDVPFKGVSIPSIMNKHLTSPPPTLAERGVPVTQLVEDAVMHALEKDPAKRPQTIEEFLKDLHAALISLRAAETQELSGHVESLKTIVSRPTGTIHASELAGGGKTGEISSSEAAGTIVGTGFGENSQQHGADPLSTHALSEEKRTEALNQQGAQPPTHGRETAPYIADATGLHDAQADASGPTRAFTEADARRHAEAAQQQHEAATGDAGRVRANDGQLPAQEYAAAAAVAKSKSKMPLAIVGTIILLALASLVAGLYVWKTSGVRQQTNNNGVVANSNQVVNNNGSNSDNDSREYPVVKADLVELPGGTFQIGRSEVPPFELKTEADTERLAWAYNQWPAHSATIRPFAIDRTEVTNAEYVAFVRETGYPPPPDWRRHRPSDGQEMWPVRNVSYEDAIRFAAWRSKRDGVQYRLPTEEEWEYAARGGDASKLYPWGSQWIDGRANLDGNTLQPVGSFKDGATAQGVQDMIGNVWEWTTTQATMYKGNNRLRLGADDEGKVIVRGGSYQSSASGDQPVTATSRRWVSKDKKDPVIGFRLVRPKS